MVDRSDLIARYPVVFHAADARGWSSIQAWGLMPTAALLHACAEPVDQEDRKLRPTLRELTLPSEVTHTVVLRDQSPLKCLDSALEDGTTREEFLDILDERCFFWVTENRLRKIVHGRAYKNTPQVVLTVDTESLIDTYGEKIELSPYNSGVTFGSNAPKRGKGTFRSIERYDYDGWHRKRGKSTDPLVELTIVDSIPDIMDHVTDVRHYPGPDFADLC